MKKLSAYEIVFWAIFVAMVFGGLTMIALTINIL
jgi:hypothetical protein